MPVGRCLVCRSCAASPRRGSPAAGFRSPVGADHFSLLARRKVTKKPPAQPGQGWELCAVVVVLAGPPRDLARLRRASDRLSALGSLFFAGPKKSNQKKRPA